MSNLAIAVAVYMSYLFGSISTALIVARVMGLPDPRKTGSGNPGATNVLRIGGKKAGAITLLGDSLKGTIAVLLAKWYGIENLGLALVAFAAFIGHIFPIYYRFKGGKGVATAIGCLFALSWQAGFCWLATWLIVAGISRYASLASLIASLAAPFYIWFYTDNIAYTIILFLMSIILIIRHTDNIRRLIAGQEGKLTKKK